VNEVTTEGAFIVAGIGYRAAVTGADIIALVRKSMAEHGIDAVSCLAVPGFKPDTDKAPAQAANALDLPLSVISEPALAHAAPHCPTTMRHPMPGVGDRSVAEACALAAAGAGGVLLGPRILGQSASCALARRAGPAP
jgi:cobalamin biosynthesis protein CbiG